MPGRIKTRITLGYILLFCCSFLVLGGVLSRFFWDRQVDFLRSELERKAELLKTARGLDALAGPGELQRLRGAAGARVTLIDPAGEVLADSDYDPRLLPNQAGAPEVKAALQSGRGSSIRKEGGDYFLFVATAVPGERPGAAGVLRLSVSLSRVDASIWKMWQILLEALLVVLAGGGFLSTRLAAGLTRPLSEIAAVARRIARGEWEEVRPLTQDEVGELAAAVNAMSRTLREKVQELAESKRLLEAVLANMESGVVLVDQVGRISLVNRAAGELLGIREEEVLGRSHVEVVKNYPLSFLIDEVRRNRQPKREEISLIFPKERILEAHAAPVFGEGRDPRGVAVVLHDVSEIRRLERVRAEFVANVSHELKTPITAVKGFAETLLSGALYNYRAAEEFVHIIYEEAERLSRLIHDLLELSRIESREVRMQIEPLDLGSEIKRIVSKLKPQFQKKELALGVDLPSRAVLVEADRDRLEQVLLNLLDNSLKYTPRGGQVEVLAREEDHEVVVGVKDTGIGIPQEDLPRIFERFYRVDKARSRKLGGTGLGLAIVKHIVEAHRGRVWVESEAGKGSTFYFSLPKEIKGNEEKTTA
ncbi:MAG: PAS domain-containing protein [Firmicutes bacterium]|nr:PAS domain-containing protein [Bacillota bacterium]